MTAYSKNIWVNNTTPALNATNLNHLTDELKAQALAEGIAHTLPTWANGVSPAVSDAAPLNEMERVAKAVQVALGIASYTVTTWAANWTPARNAANLIHLEAQVAANRTAIDNPVVFSKYAAPAGSGGSDANPGTLAQPYATLVTLFANLAPGQTGAMRGGTYGGLTIRHTLTAHSGTAGNPITITAYPGETPIVKGVIVVNSSVNYLTISRLTLDSMNTLGSNCGALDATSHSISGNDIIFEYNDMYQSVSGATIKGSCVYIGGGTRQIYRYNKMHDFGGCFAYDHGVYIGHGSLHDIHHNWIWGDTHGWGVQYYSGGSNDSTDSIFHHNVVDACGGGAIMCNAGNNNDVYNNVISNSTGMTTEAPSFIVGAGISGCGSSGTNDRFRDNDCWNNPGGVGSTAGVSITGNITTDPLFIDAANHNYAIQGGSPVAGWGLPTAVGPLA